MPRYIDADALEVVCFTDREGSFSDGVQWLLEYIDGLPSADVVEVVRCKDCKHCGYSPTHNQYWCEGRQVFAEHYCSRAERRTDE